jgi:density-regulated protein DRP1
MAEVATPGVAPLVVEYHPITGIPEEYNEFLPKDCAEYKALKGLASTPAAGADVDGADGADGADMAKLSLKEGDEQPKESSKSSKKKKSKEPAVVIETNKRNKRKTTTIITGLDLFGVKLPEAAKMFKTKFASGCAVTKNAENKEELTCQGDFLDQAVTLILKNYNVDKKVIFKLESKKRVPYFDDDE